METVAVLASTHQKSLPNLPAVADYTTPDTLKKLPQKGIGAAPALMAFQNDVMPYLSGSPGPRYFGYVTGGANPASILGDWLVSASDQDVGSAGDSLATQISLQTLAWLLDLFELNRDQFEGVFTTGATASNLLAVLAAREWAGDEFNVSVAEEGLSAAPNPLFFAGSPHVSLQKSMSIAGYGRNSFEPVELLPGRDVMEPDDLKEKLAAAGKQRKIVLTSAGTVNTGDFDDLNRVADICAEHNAWLHVDAAFGMFSRCLPGLKALSSGLEKADSITGDSHKWLNTPYECGFFFTKHMSMLERGCGTSAIYLESTSDEPEFLSRTIESSQRFRALPIWMTFKAYGREGIKSVIQSSCDHAKKLAGWIEKSINFELLAPVVLNIVVFRFKPHDYSDSASLDRLNEELLAALLQDGGIRITPGERNGKRGFRAAFCNWMTTDEDIEFAIQTLERTALAMRKCQ